MHSLREMKDLAWFRIRCNWNLHRGIFTEGVTDQRAGKSIAGEKRFVLWELNIDGWGDIISIDMVLGGSRFVWEVNRYIKDIFRKIFI